MVLKEHIVFVRNTTNSTEYVTSHEMVSIGTEAIDDLRAILLAANETLKSHPQDFFRARNLHHGRPKY